MNELKEDTVEDKQEGMLPEVKAALDKAISDFKESQESKSFSQRHPELGKMINCAVCGLRHRDRVVCNQRFALYEDGTERVNEHVGNSIFNKKRFHPHPNKRNLQLIERTRYNFDDYLHLDSVNGMKAARAQAGRELRLERKEASNKKRNQQKISRRINEVT
jgi:hypothetical protein